MEQHLPLTMQNSLHQGQGGLRASASASSRPSMLVQQPDYYASMADFDGTEFDGTDDGDLSESDEPEDNRSYDASSYDESVSYSGSEEYDDFDNTNTGTNEDEDEFSFDGSESNDGKLSPEETRKREKEKKKQKIGSLEHQRVARARIFVLLLLICTAVSNAVIVYYLNKNNELNDYSFHFQELATVVMQGTADNVRVAFQAMDAMSIALTTRVKDDSDGTRDTWPMVTFSEFALLSEEVRKVTGALQIALVPIVYEELRVPWEEYTVENNGWMREEDPLEFNRYRRWLSKASNSTTQMPLFLEDNADGDETTASEGFLTSLPPPRQYPDTSSTSSLWDDTLRYPPQPQSTAQQVQQQSRQQPPREEKQRQRREQYVEHNLRGPIPARIHPAPTREERRVPGMQYAPVWQMSPVPYYREIVNHDMYRERSFHSLSHRVYNTRRAVISPLLRDPLVELLLDEHISRDSPFDVNSRDDNSNNNNDAIIFTSNNPEHNNQKYPPISVMVQPVWDTLSPTAELAGYLIALIPWEAYLVDTFRTDTAEAALARYECEEASSDDNGDLAVRYNYEVYGGGNVTYVGPGQNFNGDGEYDFSMDQTMDFPLEPSQPAQFAEALEQFLPYNASGQLDTEEKHSPPMSGCDIQLVVYATEELRAIYITDWPIYYALMVCAVFFILSLVFFVYNCFVERRRGRAMAVAEKTNRIVNNLFPGQFADQLISEDKKKEKEAAKMQKQREKKKKKKKVVIEEAPTRQLKKFMKENKSEPHMDLTSERGGYGESPLFLAESKPIADLFPETTVLFADIAGFTAWSSVREPSQVFTLLETVYQNFDALAKQYGVFKIETIGDCYVAVCGLPEPRADHAVAMSRFSLACMSKMQVLVSQLERTLGPDTGDLTIRTGLHSGPVTAGVLRGERARFQLFGDTVNTAARMESTGLRDKIQISQSTADLLLAAGKTHWFVQREGLVTAKGKGELVTYWLQSSVVHRRQSMGGPNARRQSMGGPGRAPTARRTSMGGGSAKTSNRTDAAEGHANGVRNVAASTGSDMATKKKHIPVELSKKQQRLVEWNCDMIVKLLRQVVARRNFLKNATKPTSFTSMMNDLPKIGAGAQKQSGKTTRTTRTTTTTPMEEVVEMIPLSEFEVAAYHGSADAKHVRLDAAVVDQLERFVAILASKYKDNPFHCFEHASHVAMSVSKLLNRIVAPNLESINNRHDNNTELSSTLHLKHDMKDLHDHTYGITSDPLTQVAVVLSALIHDVDHRGVPNNVLIKEEPEMGAKYKKKSVAEQRSIDVAWEIFMDDSLNDLREALCPEPEELKRFRQIIVNSVLATDIFDPELSALRKARWMNAFELNKDDGPEVAPFDRRISSHSLAAAAKRSSFNVAAKDDNARNQINMKATIVIEHLIQASDVAHTMQHWHIYQKWNECLFKEMYQAYKKGRTDTDPSTNWYKGELWFFDNYVIPLANKLKECGVFGVSSDEYLDYATANRSEWETKGEDIVAQMLEKYGDLVVKEELGYG